MQVMSAGRGITHSEYNSSKTNPLELFQLWIETARPEITPRHETREIKLKNNQITQVVSGNKKDNLLFINQDATISLGEFSEKQKIDYKVSNNRGVFIFVIEGNVDVEEVILSRRDSIEIANATNVVINVRPDSYLMVVDVPL